jgi:hypothetical protein
METNIWVWSFNHVSTLKKIPIEIKSYEIQVENSPRNLKIKMHNTWIKEMENISNCLK